MEISLPLEKMSVDEKIQAMETIWDDLCQKAGSLASPDWHRQILQEREACIKEGSEEFISWEKAKEQILKSTQ
jgi:putative addiction module component (TIGR02574 family)